jgi:hypothetical protein
VSLLEIATSRVRLRGPACSAKAYLARHSERADEIRELFAAAPDSIPFTVVADTLSEAFHDPIKAAPLSRHIRGKCGCDAT